LVVRVIPRSPAAESGLQPGDVISQVGGNDVATSLQVQEQVDQSQIGADLAVRVMRNGQAKTIMVKPGAFPEKSS
ncbi:MAG: PDZ domain-containing protein, partial [Cyanobacteria bacterium J06633_1]